MIAARGVAASAAPARATASARAPASPRGRRTSPRAPRWPPAASRADSPPLRAQAPPPRRLPPHLRRLQDPPLQRGPPRPFSTPRRRTRTGLRQLLLPRAAPRSRPRRPPQRPQHTPPPYQQTLRRSFTLCGIGLHSGVVETVRVCPARADEGRYFVRVPAGTIPDAADDDAEGGAFSRRGLTDEETEDMLLEQLRSMMSNKDESKDGSAQRARELASKSAGGGVAGFVRLERRCSHRRVAGARAG